MVVRGLGQQAFDSACCFGFGREERGIDQRGLGAVLFGSRRRLIGSYVASFCLGTCALMPYCAVEGEGEHQEILGRALANLGAWNRGWLIWTAEVNTPDS